MTMGIVIGLQEVIVQRENHKGVVEERNEIVAAVSCVDFVFSFDEPTSCRSIDILHPNIYTMGIVHKLQHIDEESMCQALGTQFKYIGWEKIHTSRHIKSYIENQL